MTSVPDVEWEYAKDFRVVTECEADFPSLFFMIDDYWIETKPEAYLYPDESGESC